MLSPADHQIHVQNRCKQPLSNSLKREGAFCVDSECCLSSSISFGFAHAHIGGMVSDGHEGVKRRRTYEAVFGQLLQCWRLLLRFCSACTFLARRMQEFWQLFSGDSARIDVSHYKMAGYRRMPLDTTCSKLQRRMAFG